MNAVAYIRVSDASQVEGHSLDAQERLFRELCKNKGWEPLEVYCEDGRSAYTEDVFKRPTFQRLLEDAAKGSFDVVVVHCLDRWSRNLKVTLERVSHLLRHNVGFVSITENIDWSTPQGRLFGQMIGAFAEYFSGSLSTHGKKGVNGRAHKGLHLGAVPFGYQSCYVNGQLQCDQEHSGGVHLVQEEAEAVKELFCRYASGTITLSPLASWMNSKGFRTRNTKRLPGVRGESSSGPRLFTTASVRGILHNSFYAGMVKHKDQIVPGAHAPLVSQDVFDAVQVALRRNSGRSETLHPRPELEYLLKGLIRCAHCLMPLWAQTLSSGSRLYREQARSRSHMVCPADGRSIPCHTPDEQIGKIVSAIVLPEAWMDRVLAQVHLVDEVKRVREQRKDTEQRFKRLGQVYLDGLIPPEEYHRQKRSLEDRLASLVVPGVDAAREAGRLLENLPELWEQADVSECRKLLLTMLDAVYVDTIEEKSIVAITPKPAFIPLFEVAMTRPDSGVVLMGEKELPPVDEDQEAATSPCLWWRRGGSTSPCNTGCS